MNHKANELTSLEKKFKLSTATVSAILSHGTQHRVLLLHGNSSCKEVFSQIISSLIMDGHSVLAPDFPGHGASSDANDPAETYCFDGYANVVAELLQHVGWLQFVTVGWSLGGHVALELVNIRPDCVGLMLIGSPPGKPSVEALEQAFFASKTTLLAGKRDFSNEESVMYAEDMLGSQVIDPFLLAQVRRTDGAARELMFQSALNGRGIDQRKIIESTNRPVAVVHGESEPFVRLDYLKDLKFGCLWRNNIQVLKGLGHAPHWQKPEIFYPILQDFLRSLVVPVTSNFDVCD